MNNNTKILYKLHLRTYKPFFLSILALTAVINNVAVAGVHSFFYHQNPDTASVQVDTGRVENPLKDPVISNANDSLIYSLDGKRAYLFGDAEVKYQNLELKAAFIEFDMETNVVYAKGMPDSSGTIVGKPEFKEGSQVFNMDEIRYNFNTRRARITGVVTEEAGGILHSKETKKMENNHINIAGGKFTTCDLDHPHFYIGITKAKVIPGDRLITGPAYLVIEDVPFPLFLPFGFFPNSKGRASGVIIPEYGEERNRGFFLRGGGFYFGLSDYFDMHITGNVYSKGSWGATARSAYRKRYKYSGSVAYEYSQNLIGDLGVGDEIEKVGSYWIRWSHAQDPKANPNSTFQANVNFGSPSHKKYNARNVEDFHKSTITSSISYSKVWAGTPFSMTTSLSHSQNNLDSTISVGLPRVSLNMSRISPFKRKGKVGAPAWYEKIGISYSGSMDNSINTKTTELFTSESIGKMKNGVQHSIPLSTSFNLLKFITLSPSVNYSEYWYTKTIEKHWDPDAMYIQSGDTLYGMVMVDTIPGFKRAWQYNVGASMSTKIYGMFNFRSNSYVQAIRHVITPSVSLGYRPDFSEEKWGYWKKVQTDSIGSMADYSIFEQGIYGGPGRGKSGTINFSLGNNLEMKVLSDKDSTVNFKKIKLLESFNFSTSYNLLADSMNWSPVSLSARTTLLEKVNINFGGILNQYAIDSVGRLMNSFNYNETGKLFRLTSVRFNVGLSLRTGKKKGNTSGNDIQTGPGIDDLSGMDESNMDDAMFGQALGTFYSQEDYVDFEIPWNLRVDYTFSYSKPQYEKNITQTVSFSGDLSLTPKWKIGFRSGYDFKNMKLTTTSLNFYRDLHCWEMRLTVIPIGYLKSFSFQLNVKSGVLRDLKVTKKQSHIDNL